jgi:hypothetical protein
MFGLVGDFLQGNSPLLRRATLTGSRGNEPNDPHHRRRENE